MTNQDRSRAALELLYNIGHELSSSLDLHIVLNRVLDLSVNNVDAESGTLVLLNDNLEPEDAAIVYRGQYISNTLAQIQGTLDQGLAGWVLRQRETAWVCDTSADERWQRRPNDEQNPGRGKSAVCIPLLARDKPVGILTIVHHQPGFFTRDHVDLLEAIAYQAGTAIYNARLYDSLQALNRRYRELFDGNMDPILITNQTGKIIIANRRAMETTECALVGLLDHDVWEFHELRRDLLGEDFESLLPGTSISYESRLRSVDGHEIPVQVYVRRINFEGEEAIQWILRDISERKELDNMREDLIAMIYHDLRSPLANIVSSLDMLEAMIPPDVATSLESLLTIATRSVDRMNRLISSLLDINRLEAGQPITNQKAVDIYRLAREAMDAVLPLTESKQQRMTIHLPEGLPPLWVDADMIRRVLINLLENAAKFTPLQGEIIIGAELIDVAWLKIWVEDTGPGIPAESRASIFDKFVRLSADRNIRGLGLGLAFCRLAVLAHGGKIWVDAAPVKGSRFLFTLPVQ